ncbi:MAG: hypothetical protein KDN05_16160, partial [Verrucomicrobiae bacterium]|nr:hypothetical protein [Verrucomicrobiae bacterium]
TDGDGFGDEVEDNLGSWGSATATGTNPVNPDSDGDGLLDGAEVFDAGNPASSDPNLADTDGDGFDDKTEMDAGTQANNDLSRPQDGPILIANADFEAPAIAVNTNSGTVTGWTEESGGANSYIVNTDGHWAPPGSTQVGYFSNLAGAAVNQDLGYRWTSSDRYTLGIDLFEPGFRVGIAGDEVKIQLRQADGTVLWDSGTINLDDTMAGTEFALSWGAVSRFHIFTIDASAFTAGTPGEPLNLRIARVAGVNYFDNVSLEVAPAFTPRVVSCQFNGDDFEVVAENLDPAKSYDLMRGTDLAGFPTVVDSIANPGNPQTFTDANARNEETKAFYRIRETP